jgi:hypothetical protein
MGMRFWSYGPKKNESLSYPKVIYDPWHYLAVLEKKPGALRNGAPFKQWDLPESIADIRHEGHLR